ncbi:uncharacterized protein PHACADRAFT_211195 [Phanerochaete carnosa HHB-10118-sp]|uniref:Uncharacterized protein n=1 Tax=Phanerochaete carnosa (strain HHB-10118-sp) TaxID=650164 RepID=K5W2Z5_PHACS|nr:uncharacterized protein PHACADRAFT_211195 [Phanerochaete carnosa HHB-10118-sp]EKM53505.1 hypothetical protein PHACADRAFT_211195 [Phanerochaete carnosa HHB-10118-sp]
MRASRLSTARYTPSDAPRRLCRGLPPPPRAHSPTEASDSTSQPPSDMRQPARPTKHKKRKPSDARALARANPWLGIEAAHSGSEAEDGAAEDADAYNEPLSTQAPVGYDQVAVHGRSLLTRAAPTASVPMFACGTARRDVFHAGPARSSAGRSSPPLNSEDEYELGTFVVDDDKIDGHWFQMIV